MTLENPDLGLALLIVLSVIVLLQSAFIIVVVLQLSKRLGKLHSKSAEMAEKLAAALETADQTLVKADEVREKLPVWEGKISRAAAKAAQAVEDIDRTAEKVLQAARSKVRSAGQHSDTLLTRFSHTTYKVHQSVVRPSHRLSAAFSALQAGVVRFFSNRSRPTRPDESGEPQIFI